MDKKRPQISSLTAVYRLAISHNRVGSFPNYISECTRLRYLNARYNALRDFPAPVRLNLNRNWLKEAKHFYVDPAIIFLGDLRLKSQPDQEDPRRHL